MSRMAVKKCCVNNCNSCSTRKKDIGVTYHKFPKDATLHDIWITATCFNKKSDLSSLVCSRHFCTDDFQTYEDTKYVLKSDAVPSIFPWTKTEMNPSEMDKSEDKDDLPMETEDINNVSSSSKESDVENLDAIKKFIEAQEKEINELKQASTEAPSEVHNATSKENSDEDTMTVASSVMEMILSESEAKIVHNEVKQNTSCVDKSNIVALTVGCTVEAKDFSEEWHLAEVVEVDYDEIEVLVHYHFIKRPDEWISVSSPRLRPAGSGALKVKDTAAPTEVNVPIKQEPKTEDKQKQLFTVGERCLARWRDNRRFIATIQNDLGNGNYEILFDDGFKWKCNISRLHKWKPKAVDSLTLDTSSQSPSTSACSPIPGAGPSTSAGASPAYHTHLFDPTRDYLGSKSERREKKRKLNIKEIFNIGQKKQKMQPKPKKPVERKVKPKVRKVAKVTLEPLVMAQIKIPEEIKPEPVEEPETPMDVDSGPEHDDNDNLEGSVTESDVAELSDVKSDIDPVNEEEKLEKFDAEDDARHEEVIDRIKEVINKLEGEVERATSLEVEKGNRQKIEAKAIEQAEKKATINEIEIKTEEVKTETVKVDEVKTEEVKLENKQEDIEIKPTEEIQDKENDREVDKVKNELEQVKRQIAEMRKHMMSKSKRAQVLPESYLLPGEWCCRWRNGQPVGAVSEVEAEAKPDAVKPALPRRSVQVEDKRLPPGWTKHMVRRSFGHSAGKWDVVLVSPDNRRFHTKTDMRNYLENNPEAVTLKAYETALMDYGIHLKLARRMGWITHTEDGTEAPVNVISPDSLTSSPLVKRKVMKKKKDLKIKEKKRKPIKLKFKLNKLSGLSPTVRPVTDVVPLPDSTFDAAALEDGYVYVGSLKVQIIENLLRCPADGCFKNFRNNTLLQMHIKHYHRELRKMMGVTPKVLDLAYARTRTAPPGREPAGREPGRPRDDRIIRVKIPRPKREERHREPEPEVEVAPFSPELEVDVCQTSPAKSEDIKPSDSPKLRHALINKPVKRPRVLLPVRRLEPEQTEETPGPLLEGPPSAEVLDFETAISTHTVTKPGDVRKKVKKPKFASVAKRSSDDEEWFVASDGADTRSSAPGSGTPDERDAPPFPPADKDSSILIENGEVIKIERMKRDEIINCHCGFREENGLMIQCELCLCWQHAVCHNIQKEAEVPEKYTCSICLNPLRGRRSQRHLNEQERLYCGLLPAARPCDWLRRAHELCGNLLRVQLALGALRLKGHVAQKKDHPKLYLWAKDWDEVEINYTQERLNSDYSDLNIMISKHDAADAPTTSADDGDSQPHIVPAAAGSPGSSFELPLNELPFTTSELERLASSVQAEQAQAQLEVVAPQPEAPIEDGACRARLLRHIQRCHALVDARLHSIEAQVAELESQEQSFEDDETADYFPRTKQTVQMLLRDLDTMEELGVIT